MMRRSRIVPLVVVSLIIFGLAPAVLAQVAADRGAPADGNGPYTPPPCVAGVPFADVTCSTPYDAWIEQFARDGITGGCGGSNYCPGTAVTRDQMAVFVERAMRGTANWPAHTQFVWAVKASDGSPDATSSGTALLNAVAAIPTSGNDAPSSANPWLIRVGPGHYNVGSTSVSLPQHVNLEGSGMNATYLDGAAVSLLVCTGNNEVRFLSVTNTAPGSTGSFAVVIQAPTNLTQVNALALGGTAFNEGIEDTSASGTSILTDVVATGDGGSTAAFGLDDEGTYVVVRGGNYTAFGGSSNYGIYAYTGTVTVFDAIVLATPPLSTGSGTIKIAGSQISGGSVAGNVTCAGVYDASFVFHASTCP